MSSASGATLRAKQWNRHGDHPLVRPATPADFPRSEAPQRYGWIDGVGLVLPGDFIIESDGAKARVVSEQIFRKRFAPLAR